MAQLNFDATQVEPDEGRVGPVPAGWYFVSMDESELKPTQAEGGLRLATRFNIVDGQYANRKIFCGFNLKNANPVAEEISRKQLSALAHACGILQVADSSQLHGVIIKVKVKVKKAAQDSGYDDQNEITAFKSKDYVEGGEASGGPATVVPTMAAPAGVASPSVPASTAAPAGVAAPAFAAGQQPWQQPGAPAVAQPAAAPVVAAPEISIPDVAVPAVAEPVEKTDHDLLVEAGWIQHPKHPTHYYKGQDVKLKADAFATLAPAAPAVTAPDLPSVPDPASTAGAAVPPWQQPQS